MQTAIQQLISIKEELAELDLELKKVMPLAIDEALEFGKSGDLGVFGNKARVTLKFIKFEPKSPKISELESLLDTEAVIAANENFETLQSLQEQIDEIKEKMLFLSQTETGREIAEEIAVLKSEIGVEMKPQLAVSFKLK